MSELKPVQTSIDSFLALANNEDWKTFDQQVLGVCNDPAHLDWATNDGLEDPHKYTRDLALSIFEHTSQKKLTPDQEQKLTQVFKNDKSTHLKRKASFALFKFGIRLLEIIDRIKEAKQNDHDLQVRETAKQLLTQLD